MKGVCRPCVCWVDTGGLVTTTLNLPDNVGTFVVRAYAASVSTASGHAFGSAERNVVSRRTLTLQVSLARRS